MGASDPDRWYNSKFATPIGRATGLAILIAAASMGISAVAKYVFKDLSAEASLAHQYPIQEADVTGDGAPEKFYVIDGNIAVVESDGQYVINVLQSIDSCVEELEQKREWFDDIMDDAANNLE